MARCIIKLVDLKLEITGKVSNFRLGMIYNLVKFNLMKAINTYKSRVHYQYPVSKEELLSMIKIYKFNNKCFIGIRHESLPQSKYEIYKKIKDIEFGIHGHEIRLLRPVLEDVVNYYQGGHYVS